MKVLFICSGIHDDINNWSGTIKSMSKAIENNFDEVHYIENVNVNKFIKIYSKIISKLINKKILSDRSLIGTKLMAKKINKQIKIKKYDFDIIFSPSSIPIAFLKSTKPIVFYTDATFNNMKNYYDDFSNLSNTTIKSGDIIEKAALENCTYAIYSSEWARNDAIGYYKINSNKVKIIDFGLNIENNIEDVKVNEILKERINNNTIELLFIGKDFKRKGGALALEIVEEINNKGIKAILHIVGDSDEIPEKYNKYIKKYGILNKNNKIQNDKIIELYKKSHFFLLPTKADCTPIVFAEANSFALPIISTNTGGVNSVVINNKNGYCFDLNCNKDEYASKIIEIFSEKTNYLDLCISSLNEYRERLNWDVAGEKINNLLKNLKNN